MAAHPEGRVEGLVFDRADGTPLRPQGVLDQLRKRTAEAGLPRKSSPPLAVASRTDRSGVPQCRGGDLQEVAQ
ncbi:hypothetical protein P3T39_005317 [Kitasatospora sp. GP82]|nr:hypothetical protein [Kitasatospora sp. GP82]